MNLGAAEVIGVLVLLGLLVAVPYGLYRLIAAAVRRGVAEGRGEERR